MNGKSRTFGISATCGQKLSGENGSPTATASMGEYRVNLSRYIRPMRWSTRATFDPPRFSRLLKRRIVMERNEDRNVDKLIDLGSVVAETKGGANSGDDSFLQRQPNGIGLEDD